MDMETNRNKGTIIIRKMAEIHELLTCSKTNRIRYENWQGKENSESMKTCRYMERKLSVQIEQPISSNMRIIS
jgi:hypothetical protein